MYCLLEAKVTVLNTVRRLQGVDLSRIGLPQVASIARGQWGKHPRSQPAQLYALKQSPVEAAWPASKINTQQGSARHQLHAFCLLRCAHDCTSSAGVRTQNLMSEKLVGPGGKHVESQ